MTYRGKKIEIESYNKNDTFVENIPEIQPEIVDAIVAELVNCVIDILI